MNSIETTVPGVFVNERWVQTAKVMDKITIARSMTHGEAAHERGTHNMFTGYRRSPALSYPSIGSVVSHEFVTDTFLSTFAFQAFRTSLLGQATSALLCSVQSWV